MRHALLIVAILAAPFLLGARVPEPAPMKCLENHLLLTKSDQAYASPPQGDRGYDVQSYDLDVTLDPSDRTITGVNHVRLRALDDNLASVRLDLVDELSVTSVSTDRIALAYTHQGDSLVIDFPAPVPIGMIASFSITWEGAPPPHGPFRTGLMFREHESGTLNDRSDDVPIIASMGQPWSSHAWWPCKDAPGDKALVSMAMTVPDSLIAVSNGVRLDTVEHGNDWTTYRYASEYPVAPYLVSVAATNYRGWGEICQVPGDVPVVLRYHVFPQDYDNARFDLGRTCDIMEFMTDLAGPYPFAREQYAQAEFKWFGSMEHQTATSLSPTVFTGDRYNELTVVHELAHQWYGDSLTPAVWSDIWLNEGFARYIEALWVEHTEGREAYEEYMRRIGPGRYPNLWQGDGTLGDPHPILPNGVIYDKGAWVLHMLRMNIGDEAFFTFLKEYGTDPALTYGSVTLADMTGHAEAAAMEDLSPFFEPWVWTETIPVVTSTVTIEDQGSVRVSLAQRQSPLFDLTVPVRLYTECGQTDVTVRLATRTVEESWAPNCVVDSVKIDPDGMVMMRHDEDDTRSIVVTGPAPNPMTAGTATFQIYLMSDSQVTVKIYNAKGRLMTAEATPLLNATGPPGDEASRPHVWKWDPYRSKRPPSGVYWLEFVPDTGGRTVRKATLIH